MTKRRRVLSAAAICALLVLNLGCPFGGGGGPPDVDTCGDAPDEATIDGVEATASFSVGGQGSEMVLSSVEWLGADVPDCAQVEFVLRNEEGVVVDSRTESLSTEETDRGRRAKTGVYFIVSGLCRATVEVTSYGHTTTAEATNTSFRCAAPPEDAGTSADAGDPADAGMPEEDAGAPTEDAGSSTDAGTVDDAGLDDGGTSDAG